MRLEPQSDLEDASDLPRYEVPSMGNSLEHGSRCRDPKEHGAEAFCLAGSVMAGCWEAAGLIPEIDARGAVYGWKMMRCRCTFVVLMYPAGSVDPRAPFNRREVKAWVKDARSGLARDASLSAGSTPQGGSRPRSSTTGLIAGSTTSTGDPFSPLGMGSGGPA